MTRDVRPASTCERRRFLKQLTAATSFGLGASALVPNPVDSAPPVESVPTIPLGPHQVTRLIAGWNPIGGYSYLGAHMDRHMKEYFTTERTVQFLMDCERQGINAHQFSMGENTEQILREVREKGSKMKFFCLHSGRDGIRKTVQATSPIAMAHHGGVTDRLFSEGKSGEVHDYVKAAHDQGVLAGVSAHNPDCIRRIADEGWEVDFFMTCFYFLTRKMFHAAETGDGEVLSIGYAFHRADPEAMTRVVRQVKTPCLAFKILGAGRMCGSPETVRAAFRFAFENIKPSDGVIVGMYPRFTDEIRADVQYTCELATERKQA